MRLPRFTSLLTQLVAFGIALVVAGSVARFVILSETLRKDLQDVVAAEQLSLTTYVAKDIDGEIRLRQHLLEQMAADLPAILLDQPEQLQAWLAQRHALAPQFSEGITVIPASGAGAIADFPVAAGRRKLDFSHSDWFLTARDQGRFAIGKPALGRLSNRPLTNMAVPYRDGEDHVVAVIAGTTALDTPGFLDLIQNNSIGETGGYLLLSPRDNIFVAATAPEMRLKPLPPPGANPLHDRAMAGWRGADVTVNAFGVENLTAFVSVPAADWILVGRLPTAEAFLPLNRLTRATLLFSVGSAVVIVSVLVVFLTRAFGPMKRAARHMRRMANGQEPLARLPVTGQDEIREMVEAFNALMDKLREGEARMAHLAHHDTLTGLPNRALFLARVPQCAAMARRHANRLALLFIDLDGFKPINDRHGHETGDDLLQQVASRLQDNVRQADTAARFGGDEFVLLLTDIGHADQAAVVAEKLIGALSAPYRIGANEIAIGVSIGIALFPDDADDVDPLIAKADAAMYDAKRAGGNGYRFAHTRLVYDPPVYGPA